MNAETAEIRQNHEELERVVAAARDAVTDEMVGRLSDAVGESLSLLDQINRAGLDRAIPSIGKMVASGDLERLAQLAGVYGSAEDAVTDEMVGRLAETFGEGISLLDRVNRGGAIRLVEMLERLEASGALERISKTLPVLLERLEMVEGMLKCLESAALESKSSQASGGIGGIWRLMTDPKTQASLEFMIALGQRMQEQCKAHAQGG